MDIKLVALDLDGTILQDEVIAEEVRKVLDLIKSRIKIVIATGRNLDDVRRILIANGNPLDYPQTIISQEKFIHHLQDGRYLPDVEWNTKREKELKGLKKLINREAFNWLKEIRMKLLEPETCEIEEERFYLVFKTKDQAEEARVILDRLLASVKLAKIIRNKRLVSLTLSTGLKGNCLERVVRYYGIENHQVLAIGDSHNDEDMLIRDFLVATISNADVEIKELVRERNGYVALRPVGEGVVEILCKFVNRNFKLH